MPLIHRCCGAGITHARTFGGFSLLHTFKIKKSLPCWALGSTIAPAFQWNYPGNVGYLRFFGANPAKDWLLSDGGASELDLDTGDYDPVAKLRLRTCNNGVSTLSILLTSEQVEDIKVATDPGGAGFTNWIDADTEWMYLLARYTASVKVWKVDYAGENLTEVADVSPPPSGWHPASPIVVRGAVYTVTFNTDDDTTEFRRDNAIIYTEDGFITTETWIESAAGMVLAGPSVLGMLGVTAQAGIPYVIGEGGGSLEFNPEGGEDTWYCTSLGYDPLSDTIMLLWQSSEYHTPMLTVLRQPVTAGQLASQEGVGIYQMQLAKDGSSMTSGARNSAWMIPLMAPCAAETEENPNPEDCAPLATIDLYFDEQCWNWWWELTNAAGCDCSAVFVPSGDDDEICFEIECTDGSTEVLCMDWPECVVDCCDCVEFAQGIHLEFEGLPQCEYVDGDYNYYIDYAQLNYAWGVNRLTNHLSCNKTWQVDLGTDAACGDRGRWIATIIYKKDTAFEEWIEHYCVNIAATASCGPLGDDNEVQVQVGVQMFRTREPGNPDQICEFWGAYSLTPAQMVKTGITDNQICRGIIEQTKLTTTGSCSPYTVTARWRLFYPTSL